jgi:hypothetical protein
VTTDFADRLREERLEVVKAFLHDWIQAMPDLPESCTGMEFRLGLRIIYDDGNTVLLDVPGVLSQQDS